MNFVRIEDLISDVKKQDKVVFLLRHAERRHITKDDAQFGANVLLTEEGRSQAFKLGSVFPTIGEASYFSSPVGRCKETAAYIAKGRGDTGSNSPVKLEVMDALGNFFVKDFESYAESLKNNFYQQLLDYIKNGEHPAFLPLKETAEEFLNIMLEKSYDQWNFFLSHDAWIVPCLSHFLNMEFSLNRWMNFLSGLAIIVSPSGSKIYPVTGLKDGYIYY